MTRRNHPYLQATALLGLALVVALGLSACGGDAPIPVYVTPTLPGDATEPVVEVSPLPTSPAPAPTETPPTSGTYGPLVGMVPTGTTPAPALPPGTPGVFGPITAQSLTPALSPAGPTAALDSTHATATSVPPGGFGAIVGPDYTPMPTVDRRTPSGMVPPPPPTSGPSPTPGPALKRDLLGIQIHPHIDSSEFYDALAHAHALGVTWIKYQFNWSLLESAPGQYTDLFYMLRLYIQETHKQGFKVMIGVTKAPLWARVAGPDGQKLEDGPPQDPQALANFLSGMLTLIGRDVDGQPYVDAIEVWNEPNLRREWRDHAMTGAEYMRYFRPAYSAIRAFSPHITIITAAPAPTGDSPESTNDRTWLRQLYNAGLAAYGADVAVGVHPYGWANPPEARCCGGPTSGWNESPQFFFLETIEDYREIMVAHGHQAAQLWATEFGWATFDGLQTIGGGAPPSPTGSGFFGYINQYQQAEYTVRAFALGQELPYMGPMILWNLNFATLAGAVDQSDQQAGYGLLDNRFQPRPVYVALRDAPKQ